MYDFHDFWKTSITAKKWPVTSKPFDFWTFLWSSKLSSAKFCMVIRQRNFQNMHDWGILNVGMNKSKIENFGNCWPKSVFLWLWGSDIDWHRQHGYQNDPQFMGFHVWCRFWCAEVRKTDIFGSKVIRLFKKKVSFKQLWHTISYWVF